MKKFAMFLSVLLIAVTLAAPVSAAVNVNPSVEQKPAPPVDTVTDANGNEVSAIIRDQDGNEVHGVASGDITVTPVSALEQAAADISEMLSNAYEQIQQANTIADLVPTIGDFLQTIGSAAQVADLVVRDVFDVSLTGTAAEYLAQEGNNITLRFDVGVAPSATLIVLHNYEGSNWEIIPDDRVVQNADGTVDVTFDSLSPIAFVVDSTETDTSASTDANAPTSPQTGDSSLPPVAGAGLIALGCVALASAAVVWTTRAELNEIPSGCPRPERDRGNPRRGPCSFGGYAVAAALGEHPGRACLLPGAVFGCRGRRPRGWQGNHLL